MAWYRKKPILIEAWQFTGNQVDFKYAPDWFQRGLEGLQIQWAKGVLHIQTKEGMMTAQPKDWIISGVIGELYPCKPDVFEKTYDLA